MDLEGACPFPPPAIASLPFGHVDDALVLPNSRAVELAVDDHGGWSFVVEPRP